MVDGRSRPLGKKKQPRVAPADTRDVADQVDDRVEHAERLAATHALKTREREALFLKGAGYSYREVAAITNAVL